MRLEEHCARCEALLGDRHENVNRWIDELAWRTPEGKRYERAGWTSHCGPLNPHHRRHRHNAKGIDEVRARWGEEAAKAAELHVLDDHFGPCPHAEAQRAMIPKDSADYVRKGWE